MQLGPDPDFDWPDDAMSGGGRRLLGGEGPGSASGAEGGSNKRSFGVYRLLGGEQVVVKRGRHTVLHFTENEAGGVLRSGTRGGQGDTLVPLIHAEESLCLSL